MIDNKSSNGSETEIVKESASKLNKILVIDVILGLAMVVYVLRIVIRYW